jgi:predicted transcriptional regulator
MARPRRNVTDTELAVLKALWEHGPSTIRELTDRLYPEGGTAHYATVQKLLERLEAKRCVSRKPRGRVNVYTAKVDRTALIADRLRETADRLCEGSLSPLLTHLVGSASLSRREIDALRELIERHDRRKR